MRLIKFQKQSCVPCEQVSAHLDKLGVAYETVNPYDTPEVAIKYRVRSVPTVLMVDNDNKEIFRSVGYKPEQLDELKGL